jgi:hypothetical protein
MRPHRKGLLAKVTASRREAIARHDLQIVTLSPTLIGAPPIDLWPRIVARCAVPADTHALLVAKLDHEPRRT